MAGGVIEPTPGVVTQASPLMVLLSGATAPAPAYMLGSYAPLVGDSVAAVPYLNGHLVLGAVGVSKPVFSAYANTAQAIPAASFTGVGFRTVSYDSASGFNTLTGAYTAPVAGLYSLSFFASLSVLEDARCLGTFYKNGSEILRVADYYAALGVGGSGTVQLAAADTVQVAVFLTSAASTTAGAPYTWFSGHYIGPA